MTHLTRSSDCKAKTESIQFVKSYFSLTDNNEGANVITIINLRL